jgi:hypothetical protein
LENSKAEPLLLLEKNIPAFPSGEFPDFSGSRQITTNAQTASKGRVIESL